MKRGNKDMGILSQQSIKDFEDIYEFIEKRCISFVWEIRKNGIEDSMRFDYFTLSFKKVMIHVQYGDMFGVYEMKVEDVINENFEKEIEYLKAKKKCMENDVDIFEYVDASTKSLKELTIEVAKQIKG